MNRILGKYVNGNYVVTICRDGTKIRENELGYFEPEFPESMDVCITKYCDIGCKFCLPPSTKVYKCVEDNKNEALSVAEIKIGDFVLSYDEISKQLVNEKVLRVYKRPYKGKLIVIEDDAGHTIKCTPNHKIYTANGYIAAEDLLLLDELKDID